MVIILRDFLIKRYQEHNHLSLKSHHLDFEFLVNGHTVHVSVYNAYFYSVYIFDNDGSRLLAQFVFLNLIDIIVST